MCDTSVQRKHSVISAPGLVRLPFAFSREPVDLGGLCKGNLVECIEVPFLPLRSEMSRSTTQAIVLERRTWRRHRPTSWSTTTATMDVIASRLNISPFDREAIQNEMAVSATDLEFDPFIFMSSGSYYEQVTCVVIIGRLQLVR